MISSENLLKGPSRIPTELQSKIQECDQRISPGTCEPFQQGMLVEIILDVPEETPEGILTRNPEEFP